MESLQRDILRTLLYYDIWQFPLSANELYAFLPGTRLPRPAFSAYLSTNGPGPAVGQYDGYFYIEPRTREVVLERRRRQKRARKLWRMARVSCHIIKRVPFVRGVFISGDLSKNATVPGSDIDFFILTAAGRLWIARALLILFKKTVLLNKKKFFCVNSFVTIDNLRLREENIYLATEIAHLKPLYGYAEFRTYLEANSWISHYFPNFDLDLLPAVTPNNRRSVLQRIAEALLTLLHLDALDGSLLRAMRRVWRKRYPQYDEATRERMFRSTPQESRAYGGDFEDKILALYEQKLREYGIAD